MATTFRTISASFALFGAPDALDSGDIQRGTSKAWSNRNNESARLVIALPGGKFAAGTA